MQKPVPAAKDAPHGGKRLLGFYLDPTAFGVYSN